MTDATTPRPRVLRGALATGCGQWMPIPHSNGDAVQAGNSSMATATGSRATGTDAAALVATAEMAQASVQYQPQPQPKPGQACGSCVHFNAELKICPLVDGQGSSEGWCLLWTKMVRVGFPGTSPA